MKYVVAATASSTLIIMGGIFTQSYLGRLSINETLVSGCERSAERSYQHLVTLRSQQKGDLSIARDKFQSRTTRKARWKQAQSEGVEIKIIKPQAASTRKARLAYCHHVFPDPSPFG